MECPHPLTYWPLLICVHVCICMYMYMGAYVCGVCVCVCTYNAVSYALAVYLQLSVTLPPPSHHHTCRKISSRSQTSPHLSDSEDLGVVNKEEEAIDIDKPPSSPGHSAYEPLMAEFSTPKPSASGATRKTPRVKRGSEGSVDQVKRVRMQYYINKVGYMKSTQRGLKIKKIVPFKAIARVTEGLLLTVTQKVCCFSLHNCS